jgi:hypothetical protein
VPDLQKLVVFALVFARVEEGKGIASTLREALEDRLGLGVGALVPTRSCCPNPGPGISNSSTARST